MERKKVFDVVAGAIEELNEELDYDSLRDVSDETPVYGGKESIDSLSLVRLVVALEEEIELEFDKRVVLTDEKAMSMKSSPYKTAGSLTEFILHNLEQDDG